METENSNQNFGQENQTQKSMKPLKETDVFWQSNTAKMLLIGLLALVLLIPLEYVKNLISERSKRKQEVVDEVTTLWGKDINFYGPILKIPYKRYDEVNISDGKSIIKQKKTVIDYAYFFPNTLNNQTNAIKNNGLKRGIYNHVVFTASMNFSGNFSDIKFNKLNINPEDIIWDKSSIVVKTTNLKSIKSDLVLNVNNQNLKFESKDSEDKDFGMLETSTFNFKEIAKSDVLNFKFNMKYNGSNSITFIPIGKTTNVGVDSDWDSPSFHGAFAANDTTKSIKKTGFHADWKILDINRSFSQEYKTKLPNLNEYSFGVKLIEMVDEYQQNDRAAKYGFLVIGLTFLIIFLIQTISEIKIHAFQYSMIGLALIMFYTLLISITEHSSFKLAYIIAGFAVISMITIYSKSILKDFRFPIMIATSLTALYTFIYVIIQLENYALLVGSIGLFMILGAVMYFSRNIEWEK